MSQHLSRKRSVFGDALKYHFLEKKLNTGYGYFLLALLAFGTGYATMIDFKIGLGMVVLFVAILVVIIFLKYPYIGFYFMICFFVDHYHARQAYSSSFSFQRFS